LRDLRHQCAEEEGFPAYIVFSDKVLHSLATIKPTTIDAFGFIQGIGEYKKQKYGQRFVALIRRFV
jgi:ATP-dependent DNA helicase RecQ